LWLKASTSSDIYFSEWDPLGVIIVVISMTFVTFTLPINQPLVLLTENKTHCMQVSIYSYPAGEQDGKPFSSNRLQIFFL
jgi:hypothetical protein